MAAKGTADAACMTRLLKVLVLLIGNRAALRCQAPITLAFDSEPEPDFAIVRNRGNDYESTHPTPVETLLVMEVANSSLECDQQVKLPLYAEAQISDYWLFNLSDRYLETYSKSFQMSSGQFGYLNRQIITPDGTIALPPFPEQVLSLDGIFP